MSAFAAAKLARSGLSSPAPSSNSESTTNVDTLATAVATVPYDGYHSRVTTPSAPSVEEKVAPPPPNDAGSNQLSTFRFTEKSVIQDDHDFLEISLQHDVTAAFVGEYDVIVISGIVTVYGAVLRPSSSPQRIYAPSTLALPQIQARQQSTAIRISSVKSSLRKLERLSPLFRNTWAANSAEERSFAFLTTTGDDALQRSLGALDIDPDMDTVLRTLSGKAVVESQKPRIMAVGAKSSGKSTFNRILCNHLWSWTPAKKCIYLDLDPGQPEFGPPGQVSLVEVSAPILGPPFTHQASARSNNFRLIRSHTIAATNFKDDAEHYKACAADLVRHVDQRYPVIVNSCGWVSGLGASVLSDLSASLQTSDIILLEPLDTGLVDTLAFSAHGLAFHRISRRVPRPSSRTPTETRAMQTMSYFHHRLNAPEGTLRWSSKSINRLRPWLVSYAGSDPGVFAVMSYGQSPNSEFLAEVLDGSLVAMVVLNENTEEVQDLADHVDRTIEGIPYIMLNAQGVNRTLDPRTSQCIGLALVRGIDTVQKELHLVTPLPEGQAAELIEKKVVLVRGSFDPAGWAYLEELYKNGEGAAATGDDDARPWVSKKGMIGIEGAVWRLRHPPMASAVTPNR